MNGNYENNNPQQWGPIQATQDQHPQWGPSLQQAPPPPRKKRKWLGWAVGTGIAIILISAMSGGGNSQSATVPNTTSVGTTKASGGGKSTAPVGPAIETDAGEMINALETNALKAKQTYEGKRVTVKGYVGGIDASGDYFSVDPKVDAFVLTGVQAYPQTEEHRAQLAEFTKNESVTVTGTVTGVGEIMGYSIDIETIN